MHARIVAHPNTKFTPDIPGEYGENFEHLQLTGRPQRPLQLCELQLAHQERDAISASYNHALYLEPRAKMMQAWADYLDELRRQAEEKAMQQEHQWPA